MLKKIEKYFGILLLIGCILFWAGFFKIGISAINGNKISQILIFAITTTLITCMTFMFRDKFCYTPTADNELEK